jgi:nitroreductase
MELKDAIEKRRTIRDFQNTEVPFNIINYAIENAFKAPSYNHLREWDFIIIKNLESKLSLINAENLDKTPSKVELESVFENEATIMKEMYLDAIPKQKKMILNAPLVIIVVFKPKTKVLDAKKIYDLNCLASVWACIENFLLSLAEHDVFGVTYIPQNIETVKERLRIPDNLEIAAIIPIGYKDNSAKVLKQKTIDITGIVQARPAKRPTVLPE